MRIPAEDIDRIMTCVYQFEDQLETHEQKMAFDNFATTLLIVLSRVMEDKDE